MASDENADVQCQRCAPYGLCTPGPCVVKMDRGANGGRPALPRLVDPSTVSFVPPPRPDIVPETAGLHAVSFGLSALAGDDDHGLLERGFMVYDALFAWLRFAAEERHNWPAKAA